MKRATYFAIAFLTVFTQSREAPVSKWEWLQLIASCIVGGCIALRALESRPGPDAPQPAEPQKTIDPPGGSV